MLGVIKPAVEALHQPESNLVGLIGTYATVKSKAFIKEVSKIQPKIKVYQQACPLLVPIIEEGEFDWVGLDLILIKYHWDVPKLHQI